jgi:hypothetical protein
MKEGNAISLSQKHSHPDVRLEAHERTVLAVPICAHNKFTDVSSSFSDLLSGAVVGCVEVRCLPPAQLAHTQPARYP